MKLEKNGDKSVQKSKFRKDLADGQVAEQAVAKLLDTIQIKSLPSIRSPYYDFDHGDFKSEVKYDIWARRSGNIAIEFYNPKKASHSGISITTANLWFQVIPAPMEIWVASVERLKYYTMNKFPLRIIEAGGDGNASFYLYKKDEIFFDIFNRVDNLGPENLRNIIADLTNLKGKV